jgi:hypothetical protein
MSALIGQQIIEALQRRDPPAAFASELAAAVRPAEPAEVEDALTELDAIGRIIVMQHAAPDVHLESTDLRVVAHVPSQGAEHEARDAAEATWDAWLRLFLATHRCE